MTETPPPNVAIHGPFWGTSKQSGVTGLQERVMSEKIGFGTG